MEAKVDPKAGLQIGPNAYIITEIKTPEAGQKLIDTVNSLHHDDWVWNFNPVSYFKPYIFVLHLNFIVFVSQFTLSFRCPITYS